MINYNEKNLIAHDCYQSIANGSLDPAPSILTNPIADSGCSGHYAAFSLPQVKLFFCNAKPATSNSISTSLPDGNTMKSTHAALSPNTHLLKVARVIYLFPKMKRFLISLRRFCDSGMTIYLTEKAITVCKSNTDRTVILRGARSMTDSMWCLDLKPTAPPAPAHQEKVSNSVYELNKKENIIKYLSTVMWNLVLETWIKAIDAGFFAAWLGLT